METVLEHPAANDDMGHKRFSRAYDPGWLKKSITSDTHRTLPHYTYYTGWHPVKEEHITSNIYILLLSTSAVRAHSSLLLLMTDQKPGTMRGRTR